MLLVRDPRTENLVPIGAIPFELRPEKIIDAFSREGERIERAQKLSGILHMALGWKNMVGIVCEGERIDKSREGERIAACSRSERKFRTWVP